MTTDRAPMARQIQPGDLISDSRVTNAADDLLDHDAIARSIAEISVSAETPVNIALFGAWGSGKSSIYSMIVAHLDQVARGSFRVARYDAWKYGGEDLKRNFIDSVAFDLKLGHVPDFSEGLDTEQVRSNIALGRWILDNWRSLLGGIVLAFLLATVWVVALATPFLYLGDQGFLDLIRAQIPMAGTVFGLALAALLVGPKVLEGAVVTTKTPAPSGADQFAKRFSKLVEMAQDTVPLSDKTHATLAVSDSKRGAIANIKSLLRNNLKPRLIVFVDELDRCSPEDVVATLIDLKTFLDQEHCVFIVAADREVLEQALDKVPQGKPVRTEEPYYATPGAFIDKIFQHQIALPPLRARALTQFAHSLAIDQGGLWQQLRSMQSDTFELTIFALIPVHVRSPRRVKVLLNNFATTVRIADARGVEWKSRVHELAVLAVLQTEFPSVADELRRIPRLLEYLRGDTTPTFAEAEQAISKFAPNPTPLEQDKETAAGVLLSDRDDVDVSSRRTKATVTLHRNLVMYLSKINAAGISDPRPDLLYMKTADTTGRLDDPALADIIDFATDTAPDDVLKAFDTQPPSVLVTAAMLLVAEGDNSYGPGRRFAYESACRMIEEIDEDSLRVVLTRESGPSIIAALTKGNLSDESIPGAMKIAIWSGQKLAVSAALNSAPFSDLPDSMVKRIGLLLPLIGDEEFEEIANEYSDIYKRRPDPLHEILSSIQPKVAIRLWSYTAKRVLRTIENLESPPSEMPATNPGTSEDAQAPPLPAGTGVGVKRLGELLELIRQRPDSEELVSQVVLTVQNSRAVSFQIWVTQNCDELIGHMSDPTRRAQHALSGIEQYPSGNWTRWLQYLPTESDAFASPAISHQADTVLREQLLPAIPRAETSTGALKDAIHALKSIATESSDGYLEIFERISKNMTWVVNDRDDPNAVVQWTRMRLCIESAIIVARGPSDGLVEFAAKKLFDAVTEIEINDSFVEEWLSISEILPRFGMDILSSKVDEFDFPVDESAHGLKLKLAIRRSNGGPSINADVLLAIDHSHLSTEIVGDWLSLAPPAKDVKKLIKVARFGPVNLKKYCDQVGVEDRTDLWIAFCQNSVADSILSAAGIAGVGAEAVTFINERVRSASRQVDRASSIRLLIETASVNADEVGSKATRKAANEIVQYLLELDQTGDVRLAAELVIWAGGAARGFTLDLRARFTKANSQHKSALTNSLRQRLIQFELLETSGRRKIAIPFFNRNP